VFNTVELPIVQLIISLDRQIAVCETIVIKKEKFSKEESVIMVAATIDYKMSKHVSINIGADANLKVHNVYIVFTKPHPN
jgi:hypothetical protein